MPHGDRRFEVTLAAMPASEPDLHHETQLVKIGILYGESARLYSPRASVLEMFRGAADVEPREFAKFLRAMAGQVAEPDTARELVATIDEYLRLVRRHRWLSNRQKQYKKRLELRLRQFFAYLGSIHPEFVRDAKALELYQAVQSGFLKIEPLGVEFEPTDVIQDFVARAQAEIMTGSSFPLYDEATSDYIASAVSSGEFSPSEASVARGRNLPLVARLLHRLPLFERATVSEILDIRRELERPLVRFRSAMLELSSGLRSAPWDRTEMEREIDLVIHQKIEPAMLDIEDAYRSNRYLEHLLFAVTKNPIGVGSASGLGMLVSQAAAIPMLSAGALGLGAGAVAAWAQGHKEWLDRETAIRGNQLFFYYRAGRRFRMRRWLRWRRRSA